MRQDPALTPRASTPLPDALEASLATPLYGRERELAELRAAWTRVRAGAAQVVTISGQLGSGTTRLAAELAAEAHADGAAVAYGGRAPAVRPALLVLDEVPLDAVPREPRLLTVVCGVTAPRADVAIRLAALPAAAAGEIAAAYAPAHVREIPVEQLLAETGGLPSAVHEWARQWARREAARHVDAVAGRTAAGRAELRSMERELAGGVAELQAARDRTAGARGALPVCPYKGLAAFDTADSEYYCGRERLVAELIARLVGTPLLGIVGPSGSGKSSLLRAGLLAALASGVLPGSERWHQVVIRPGEHPHGPPLPADGERVVLAVDQFEEIFTTCSDEAERAALIATLTGLAGERVTVLLALRADQYGRCGAYPEFAGLLMRNHVLVPPIRPHELRQAIELPAERAGLEVEAGLADALVADVAGEPGALPLLSSALLDLWQRRDGRRLRLAVYDEIGGVRAAVARLADDAYDQLEAGQHEIARRILLLLVVEPEDGTFERRRMPLPEDAGELAVVERLADQRLLTITEGTMEVAHEALFREWPRLRAWLQEDAESRRVQRQLAEAMRAWEDGGRARDDLYRGGRLESALEWQSRHQPGPEEQAFLSASAAAESRGRRRLQAGVVGLALALVVAVTAGAVALRQRGHALDVARSAQAQRLGAQGLGEQALDRALLLAVEGVSLEDSAVTRSQLLRALLRSPTATWVMRGASAWTAVDTSPDGRLVAVGDDTGKLALVDPRTRQIRKRTVEDAAPITDVRFSPDGTRLAVAAERFVLLLDARTRRPVTTWFADFSSRVPRVAFSPDSRTLAASVLHYADPDPTTWFHDANVEGEVIRWDARSGRQLDRFSRALARPADALADFAAGGELVTVGGTTAPTDPETLSVLRRFGAGGAPAALSPNRRVLALGAADGSLRLLDLITGSVRRATGGHRGAIRQMRFSADSRLLASAGDDAQVMVWDTRRAATIATFSGHAAPVAAVSISAERRTVYSAGLDGALIAWDLTGTRGLGREFRTGAAADSPAPFLAVSADGSVFATVGPDGARVYNSRTLALTRRIRPGEKAVIVSEPALSPDGRLLALGTAERGIVLIDTRSGAARALPGSPTLCRCAFSPDGHWLAAVDLNVDELQLWDRRDAMRRPVKTVPLRVDAGEMPAFDPHGRWVAVGAEDPGSQIRLLSLPGLMELRRTAAPPGFLSRLAPDGRTYLRGGVDGRTWRYDTSTLAPAGPPLEGRDGAIGSLTVSAGGRWLVTTSARGPALLWDLTSEPPLATALPSGDHQDVAAGFIRDGSQLVTIADDGSGRLWDLRLTEWVRRACAIAGHSLTRDEWREFLPGRPYAPVCR